MNKFTILAIFILIFMLPVKASELLQDEFVNEWYQDKVVETITPYSDYNYASTERFKILITPTEKLYVSKNVKEGQIVNFVVKRNVRLDNTRLLKKGTPVQGLVEMYTTSGMTGVQGTMTIGRLSIPGLESEKLHYYLVKEGQNRTLWIMPIKLALTFVPFVGSFTNLIKGGQAKLTPSDTFIVYYYPNR